MGLFSKLFGSNTANETPVAESTDATQAESRAREDAAELIPTPAVMPAYVPSAARPTPTDVFERETVPRLNPALEGERATVVAPEPAAAPPHADVAPPPRTPLAKAQPRPQDRKPPPLPPPRRARPPVPRRADEVMPLTEDELDEGFTAIERKSSRPPRPGTLEVDVTDVRKLFAELAAGHMRQVRDFVIELRWGPTPATWVAVCESSVESLRRAAEGLELAALADKLHELASAMQAHDVATATTIDGDARDRILAAHAELAKLLPETFALDGDRSQREAAILHSLLSQIPDVGKVTIDKLYAAGVTTLETMLLATAEDLAVTTGIAQALAAAIVERFRLYREEMAAAAIDESRTHERDKISALVKQLRAETEELERAASAWTNEAMQKKKEIVLARTQTMLAIDLQLARLGEIALVRELERLSFARKVLRLDTFLARDDAVS